MLFKDLSPRASNVCKDNNIYSIDDLKAFVNHGGDLNLLRNCGRKTVLELNNLISETQKSIENKNEKGTKNGDILNEKYKNIQHNQFKKDCFDSDFKSLLNNLSVRSKNGYFKIVKNYRNDIDGFINEALFNDLDLGSIRNLGKKSISELDWFKKNIKYLIEEYAAKKIDKFDFIKVKTENLLGVSFDKIEISEHKFINSIKSKELDLVYFFDSYILNHSIKKYVDNLLLLRYLSPNNDKVNSLEKISKKVGLTRERVRQISAKTSFNSKFSGLSNLLPFSYNIIDSLNQNYFKVEFPLNFVKKNLNFLEYNTSTLARILNVILDDYSVIYEGEELKAISSHGEIYKHDLYKSNRRIKVNYIFSKEFINKDLCLEVLNEIFHRTCFIIKEDYFYNPFLNFKLSNQQEEFLNELITKNFNLSTSSKGVHFRRNSLVTNDELIVEVLRKFDKPILIDELHRQLRNYYPTKFKGKDVESIRSTIVRYKEKFIYMRGAKGRKTLYGLKEWERTKNLKGGSIKQLCINYLESKSTPVHMLELSRFIIKNRETNQKNILTNLKLDPHNNFVYFKSNFIGLRKKKYKKAFIDSIKSFGGTKSAKVFEFLKNNIYYNYNSLINKFSLQLKAYPIQIEQSIIYGIQNEIIYKKDEKVYYNSVQEDFIINDLFKSIEDANILGYNPYRVSFNDEKIVLRVIQSLNNNVALLDSNFEFDDNSFYDRGYFSKYRCLLIFNPSLSKYRAYLWYGALDIDKIELNFKLDDENDFSIYNIDTTVNVVDFRRNKINKFFAFLNVLIDSDMKYDEFVIDGRSINMNYLDIDNISELNAISKIISEALEKFNSEIDISEAREIYQRIKLSKS